MSARQMVYSSSAWERGRPSNDVPRILVIEDDYFVATELEAGLAEMGFEVVGIATSADEALALAAERAPTLAVVDIRLHGVRTGVDAAVEMFQRHGIRSLFATAHHDPRMRSQAEPANPLGWVPKPYTVEQVGEAIRNALPLLRKP